jgi:hypothetical protein
MGLSMLQLLDLARENAAVKLELKRIRGGAIRQTWADRACRRQDVHQGRARNMATTYHVNLFIQVPDEGETEAWQVEQALRDAAEEHLWQVVSLTVTPAENP